MLLRKEVVSVSPNFASSASIEMKNLSSKRLKADRVEERMVVKPVQSQHR